MVFRFLKLSATFLLTLFVLWCAGFLWFIASTLFLSKEQHQGTAEAIIVLTGGEQRIATGLSLLKDQKAKKLFISGVHQNVTIDDLIDKKPIPCCITLGYEARDTKGNAAESRKWIVDNNIQSILLVTSNYHIIRAYLEFKHALGKIQIVSYPVPSSESINQETGQLLFEEYNKTLLSWLRIHLSK